MCPAEDKSPAVTQTPARRDAGLLQELIYEATKKHDKRTHNDYDVVLDVVRDRISSNYAGELAASVDKPEMKARVLDLISDAIIALHLHVQDCPTAYALANRIYNDMVSFGCITDYLYDDNVEEINCHSWEDIEIVTRTGYMKAPVAFSSPQQCQDITKKMVRIGGVILDGSFPLGDSYIKRGVRIAAAIPPVVPVEAGATFSIRKQTKKTIAREELIRNGTTTEAELDFLLACINNGISVGIAGGTNSGKTTDMNYLLRNADVNRRVYTIEDTLELDLIRRGENGRVMSRVVSTKTRLNGNKNTDVTRQDLLRFSLRQDPDIIVPAEMRGEEARESVEAGLTGHTVLTTFHANNALDAYSRILTMYSMSGSRLSETLLMKNIIKAYPVMLFKQRLRDGSRRYMRIVEAVGYRDGDVKTRTLYEYLVTENRTDEATGRVTVEGRHRKVHGISDSLANRMLENGASTALVRKYAEEGWEPGKERPYDL